MSFSSKKNSFSSNKKIGQISNTPSQGDTFFDSIHNSKYLYDYKKNNKSKKENNFFLALNCVLSPIQENILLGTSEFSDFNPNQTKDENISRYLHHPITKEIAKEGNKIVRIQSKQSYDTIGNHPYISKYNNMKILFNDLLLSLKDFKNNESIPGRRTLNYNNNHLKNYLESNKYNTMNIIKYTNETNNYTNNISHLNKRGNEHQKNKSSMTNTNYNNKNNNYNSNCTKDKNKQTNKSCQINSTTITKENFNKNNKKEEDEVLDIKKQIKYGDKLEDLEEPKDIDLKNYIDEENKNLFLNDYDSNLSSPNINKKRNILKTDKNEKVFSDNNNNNTDSKPSKNDEIFIFDSLANNINSTKKNSLNISKTKEQRRTTTKMLRKKYERSEFKKHIFNTNPKINRYAYLNPNNNNLDSNGINSRKLTLELNEKISGSIEIGNNLKNKIYHTCKKSNQFDDINLKTESNNDNINKNLLDNFNDCGAVQKNDFLNYNTNIKEKKNIPLNNKEYNKKSKNIGINNNSLEAEFLDFISNKSETIINNNSVSKMNKLSNDNNTFIVKDISNKIESQNEIEQNDNNLDNFKSNSIKSEKLIIKNYTSSMSQTYKEDNISFIKNNHKNCLYDYASPEKNPDALIRENFSLISSFDNSIYGNSLLDEWKNDYHSYRNKMKYNKYNKLFSLNVESRNSDTIDINLNISLNTSNKKRNKKYLMNNKEKLKETLNNIAPETVYDLSFYQNLIENNKKLRKINYKNILKNHKKIKWIDRLHTLCWMMQTCEEFAFKRDTFHYACNYFDNYLSFSQEKIKNVKTLQLIGITCISISGKIEEVQIPKLKEYAGSIDQIFGIKDIIEMEQKICLTLGWKLINTNINTWLNWYTCQWDLYIDSFEDIKEELLKFINEEDIIYYKKTTDISYYNYRKICQLVDIIILDYYSYNFDPRVLMSVCLLIIICINYNLDYNFKKKNFKQKTDFSQYIFEVYIQFLNQSFDFNFFDKEIQKALEYVYKFKNFNFSYELPLFYQIHQDMLEFGNYEDFISYQTTNENLEDFMKDIYSKRNIKDSSEKTTSHTDKNKFFSSHKSSLK